MRSCGPSCKCFRLVIGIGIEHCFSPGYTKSRQMMPNSSNNPPSFPDVSPSAPVFQCSFRTSCGKWSRKKSLWWDWSNQLQLIYLGSSRFWKSPLGWSWLSLADGTWVDGSELGKAKSFSRPKLWDEYLEILYVLRLLGHEEGSLKGELEFIWWYLDEYICTWPVLLRY